MTAVADAARAIRSGGTAVIPTDTVYGLAGNGHVPEGAAAVYALKGRAATQPTALVLASIDVLRDCLPELEGPAARVVDALLPGPYTLVLPNPAGRFAWLTGDRREALGVRVPALVGPARAVLDEVGAVVATSANLPGGPDPRSLADVPRVILDAVDAVVDGGTLAGRPSTVIDLTGSEPRVLREGAVPGADALARVERALTAS